MRLLGFIVLLTLFLVYRFWFSFHNTLSSGDWPYLFRETIAQFPFFSKEWVLWLAPYYQSTAKVFVQYLGFPWEIAERIFWFWPFIGICVVSSYYLTRSSLGVLIYTANTYILMVVGGGQMGVAIAYSIAPFVLKKFMNFIDAYFLSSQNIKYQISNIKNTIATGLILATQMMFDPRIAYITFFGILTYYLLLFRKSVLAKEGIFSFVSIILLPLAIGGTLNSYWIIPLVQRNIPQEFKGLESVAGFEFLSFADFSHAFSLLHPNWPENIFGKTYFMKAEFILLPILAYSSLFFINLKRKTQNNLTMQQFNPVKIASQFNGAGNTTFLFFAFVGIVGAFLAKGVNEPFGFVNEWLFQSFPGMSMFRDPTKFYLLTVLSYSVLIPFSVYNIYSWLISNFKFQISNKRFKFKIYYVFLLFAIYYLLFLIRPAVFGQLGGTFKPHAVPQEYILLKNFITIQEESFNTLWVPKVQRFGFSSKTNKAVSADQLLGSSSIPSILKKLQESKTERSIKSLNIKYIIVPYDSQKEIFLRDRKYDASFYDHTVSFLEKLEWVQRENNFVDIVVFRVL